ncbi:hypothetical protein [Paractinoplanes brasiliensis]|uniref:Peptidase inhibitor family I36 n=1 Tax=Paractinoplanes brasiliensis TaxID=52695 RepID=A0A4R6JNI9_9ACTN|nr:hypothetical protein [Actinoplanes brasiliensis]TDO36951.1 hypothetical protein C8E87_0542 [Actinoplanes brasiliensis]GID30473.1 hypothetical protein Abr02nite_54560 [Actinoplanes brasiliensis]
MKKPMYSMRRLAAVAAAGLLSIVGILAVPTPAMASADSCTGAPNGYVCVYVQGEGAFIDTITVSRGSINIPMGICNWRADAWIDDNTGRQIKFLRYDYAGCNYGRAWVDFPLNHAWVGCGSRVYAAFYEDGKRQGGYAGPVRICG